MEVKSYSLALLGDVGVGKTSLAIRLAKNVYEKGKETKGAEYYQKFFCENDQTIKIDIYGTSGAEKYQKISKFLYKDAQSIIIMYTKTDLKSFDNIKKYLENIKKFSVEKPIIYIVGNSPEPKPKRIDKHITIMTDDNEKETFKYFEISCETGEGINEMIRELTNDIIISEKYCFSKIFRDLNDLSNSDQSNLTKILLNYYKDKKPKLLRCEYCSKLFNIELKTNFNNVSFKCTKDTCKERIKKIEKIDSFMEKVINNINCKCKKKNKKELKYKLNYCLECESFYCSKCEMQQHRLHRLMPYYLIDVACFKCYSSKGYQKCIAFCKDCKESFCARCIGKIEHKNHDVKYFCDSENIKVTINEVKANLNKERQIFNDFRKNCEDCIASIKDNINNYLNKKGKELNLKEQLLDQFSYIKYNYQLHETIKNFRFMKPLKYNKNAPWNQKLTDIYEAIGMPIEIKNINISKNNNTEIKPKIETIKNNKSEFLLEDVQNDITDICCLNNELIGISYKNGILEIYENITEKKSTFTIFKNNQSINSMHKSKRNVNNYYICGPNKIKRIEFYDNYKSQKTLNELFDADKNFILCLEQDNYLITSDVNNKIILYSKDNRQLTELSDCIDKTCKKEIISLNEITNNLIYIIYNKAEGDREDNIRGRCSMQLDLPEFTLDFDSVVINQLDGIDEPKKIIELGSKIIELSHEKIKREYLLPDKQEILGVLSNSMVLIREESQVLLFDARIFKNIKRYSLELGGIPIFLGLLNKRANLVDFVLLDEKLNIFQNIYDEENQTIIQISGLKVKDELEYDITKIRKIIQIPFKSVISYIGNNQFIIINY